jgi:hypothetical protein
MVTCILKAVQKLATRVYAFIPTRESLTRLSLAIVFTVLLLNCVRRMARTAVNPLSQLSTV